MGSTYYHQTSNIRSKSLLPGTPEHDLVCDFLGLPANGSTTLEVMRKAFEEMGWCFHFDTEKIIGLEGNDDQEMPDVDELAPLTALFIGSIEWECEGDIVRTLFTGEEMIQSEGEIIFAADVYEPGKELDDEIWKAEMRLAALKEKAGNL